MGRFAGRKHGNRNRTKPLSSPSGLLPPTSFPRHPHATSARCQVPSSCEPFPPSLSHRLSHQLHGRLGDHLGWVGCVGWHFSLS